MKEDVSVICTVYNEQETISQLLDALLAQSLLPKEIIICDGGSSDNTAKIIQQYATRSLEITIILLSKRGNRSVGRNTAINKSSSSVIAITDAGCVPQKNWLEELWKVYIKSGAPVVAGYYKGLPKSAFEEAVVPYVLVMPDKVIPQDFLPATRSMLLQKNVWKSVGKFDESLSHNEDYAFSKKIKAKGFNIAFAEKAVVGWLPRENVKEFWVMIERFAQGDIEAGLVRPKVILIFLRYFLLFILLVLMIFVSSWQTIIAMMLTFFVLYSGWAIQKNSRYVKSGWYWLPVLQLISDWAVIKGSIQGLKKVR